MAITPRVPRRINVGTTDYRPVYVVWELTLRCDQPCTHCGSRAADAREHELSREEALDVVRQLKEMRAEEIVVIGGEAYLHPDFPEIVRAIKAAGIRPTMTTGGRGIGPELAAEMGKAGFFSVSVSVDGLEGTHDLMRASKGSFQAATNTLRLLKANGIRITANTNLNRLNEGDFEKLYEVLRDIGIEGWQVQLTVPLGRAADRPDMMLQPWDLLDLVPRVAEIKRQAFRDGILLFPGNSLGYFGPEEALLRSVTPDGTDHWRGCIAGRFAMGIECDGAIKGCPSLQTRHYVGGNVRDKPLREIWDTTRELAYTRTRTIDDLWGYCRTCAFAEVCMAGCTFTAHAIMGRPGNNPYCHYRARQMAKAGKRERLVPIAPAPGEPFDNGVFTIVEEPLDAPDVRLPPKVMAKPRRWKDGVALPVIEG